MSKNKPPVIFEQNFQKHNELFFWNRRKILHNVFERDNTNVFLPFLDDLSMLDPIYRLC